MLDNTWEDQWHYNLSTNNGLGSNNQDLMDTILDSSGLNCLNIVLWIGLNNLPHMYVYELLKLGLNDSLRAPKTDSFTVSMIFYSIFASIVEDWGKAFNVDLLFVWLYLNPPPPPTIILYLEFRSTRETKRKRIKKRKIYFRQIRIDVNEWKFEFIQMRILLFRAKKMLMKFRFRQRKNYLLASEINLLFFMVTRGGMKFLLL